MYEYEVEDLFALWRLSPAVPRSDSDAWPESEYFDGTGAFISDSLDCPFEAPDFLEAHSNHFRAGLIGTHELCFVGVDLVWPGGDSR